MASSSPQLSLPPSETISAPGTVSLAGLGYADSFAATNAGVLYLHIWDGTGLLSATDGQGGVVAGSGTNDIALNAGYAEISAILTSLSYSTAGSAAADTIHFDLWNQSGTETTGSIRITIGAPGPNPVETWTGMVNAHWDNGANWSTGQVPQTGDQVEIPGGTQFAPSLTGSVLIGETIGLTDDGSEGGSASFTNAALGTGTSLRDKADNTLPQAPVTLAGTFTVGSGASLGAETGSLLILQSASASAPAYVVNSGTIAGDGGNLNINTGGTVVNDGLIVARNSGGVGFDFGPSPNSFPAETILNAGTLQMNDGSLFINGAVHGGTIQYSGPGSLMLEQQNALVDGATIAGFGANDTIRLYLIQADSLSYAAGVLNVMNGSVVVESLRLSGSYSSANFRLDLQGGRQFSNVISYVPNPPPAGPQITAPDAEQVAAGDSVMVAGVSIADAFAAAHPGTLALNVTDNTGVLRMTDAGGAELAGSGTGAIHYSGTLDQINAALASLSYLASGSAATDSITVDIWDQAGQEATTRIAVTVGADNPSTIDNPIPTASAVISGTSGDDTIVSNLNGVTINAGGGNNVVFAGGTGDTIIAGDGNNTIQAFAGGNSITTGAGDDTIRLAGTGSRIDAGGGANRIEDSGSGNTLVLPAAGQGSDDIFGYVLAANDLFDLRGAMAAAGWNGVTGTLPDYLGVGSTGGDATIMVTPDGSGSGSVVATLRGSGAVAFADLLAHAVVS